MWFTDTGTLDAIGRIGTEEPSAEPRPSNSFSFGKVKRNKHKGTATLNLTLPNPGELIASGNGVGAATAGRAVISKSVPAGLAQLLIKARGKKQEEAERNRQGEAQRRGHLHPHRRRSKHAVDEGEAAGRSSSSCFARNRAPRRRSAPNRVRPKFEPEIPGRGFESRRSRHSKRLTAASR